MKQSQYLAARTVTVGPFRERRTIKGFPTLEARDAFIAKHDRGLMAPVSDPNWSTLDAMAKPGTYAFCGGEWRNVKSLDASLLAHI